MGTIALKINERKDYEMVMSILEALEGNRIITISRNEADSLAIPGPPVSKETFLKEIKNAEQSALVSGEEAKAFFESLKI